MFTNPYTFPRKHRSCLNCIHLDQPAAKPSGVWIGGCRERLRKYGVTGDKLKKGYCGQWYLLQLSDEY